MKRSEGSQDIFVFELTRLGGRLNMSDDKEGGIKTVLGFEHPSEY